MTKRILAALLSALMLLSLATACNNGGGSSSGGGDTPSVDPTTGELDLSIKRDIKMAIGQNVFITDYDDNWLTNKLESDLNCNLTVETLPAGDDGLSKLQLMINGGSELPDVFSYGLSTALMYQYGSGGTFIPLNDYYENANIMPNFNAIESEDDKTNMISAATSADGNIYCLTMFQPETWNLTPYRMYINQKWLDNLGLDMPTTTDELRDVLQTFRANDPNGNGQQDEIPLLTNYVDGGNYGCNVILALINSFTYCPGSMSSLTVSEDGKTVVAPQVSDGWKEAMKYLHSLYEAGGILPDGSFIYGTDTTGFKGTLNYQGNGTEEAPEGKSVNIVGLFSCGSNSGNFDGSGKDQNVNFLEYKMMPVLDSGVAEPYSPYSAYNAERYWFVTDAASDPAFAVYMGDYFYSREMSIAVRFGQDDVDWTDDPQTCSDWYTEHTALLEKYADVGAKQLKEDYEWVVLSETIWSDNTNHFWHNQQPRYMDLDTFSYHWGQYRDPETFTYYYGDTLVDTSLEYYSEAHPQYYLPLLTYTNEEQDKITETQVAYPEEILAWTMKFITGEADIDGDWDAYKAALDAIGLQTYVECSQAAYERTIYYQSNFQ